MFITNNTDINKTLKTQIYKPGMRLPIFNANSLLANKQHHFVLERLAELSALDQENFDMLYQAFVYRFVEFVQVLPKQILRLKKN